MTPARFQECLRVIGWSLKELAKRLNVGDTGVRKMARGTKQVPVEVATWLELLAAAHTAMPRPAGWNPP